MRFCTSCWAAMPRGSRLAKPSQQQLSPTPCSTVATQNHKHALSSLEGALSLVNLLLLLLLYGYNCHNCILDILIVQAIVTAYSVLSQKPLYVTRSRKRGPFPQKSVCEFIDLSADSTKSVVHARENRLTPKLQSFEYHTRAYLGFEISAFISVL